MFSFDYINRSLTTQKPSVTTYMHSAISNTIEEIDSSEIKCKKQEKKLDQV